MDANILKNLGKCGACDEELTLYGALPACANCGWSAFPSYRIGHVDQLCGDGANQLKVRQDYLAQLYQEARELDKLLKENDGLTSNLDAMKSLYAQQEALLLEIAQSVEYVEKQVAANAHVLDGINIDPTDHYLENIEDYRIDILEWRQIKIPNFKGEKIGRTIYIYAVEEVREVFKLALGFSRSSMILIEEAEVVLKITLHPKDFQSKHNYWVANWELPIDLEGTWHVKMTPFKENIMNEKRVSVRFETDIVNL